MILLFQPWPAGGKGSTKRGNKKEWHGRDWEGEAEIRWADGMGGLRIRAWRGACGEAGEDRWSRGQPKRLNASAEEQEPSKCKLFQQLFEHHILQ